jgi:hypothetical protein
MIVVGGVIMLVVLCHVGRNRKCEDFGLTTTKHHTRRFNLFVPTNCGVAVCGCENIYLAAIFWCSIVAIESFLALPSGALHRPTAPPKATYSFSGGFSSLSLGV